MFKAWSYTIFIFAAWLDMSFGTLLPIKLLENVVAASILGGILTT